MNEKFHINFGTILDHSILMTQRRRGAIPKTTKVYNKLGQLPKRTFVSRYAHAPAPKQRKRPIEQSHHATLPLPKRYYRNYKLNRRYNNNMNSKP